MEYAVLRNRKQIQEFIENLKEMRPPIKLAYQVVSPVRTLDANAYLWGIVYKRIADASGQSVDKVHEGYKVKYNFRFDFAFNTKTNRWEVVPETSTANLDMLTFWEYIMKVRIDGELEHRIIIEMPNEVFITDELNFNEDV